MRAVTKNKWIVVLIACSMLLSGCITTSSTATFQLDEALTGSQQIYLRFSDGTTSNLVSQTGQNTVTLSNPDGKTIVGAYVTDGHVSWVPEYSYNFTNVVVPNVNEAVPSEPADNAEPRSPQYASEKIDISFAIYDEDGMLVDDRTEVFAQAEDVIFFNTDEQDADNQTNTVPGGFSTFTTDGIATFRIAARSQSPSDLVWRLFNGPNIIYEDNISLLQGKGTAAEPYEIANGEMLNHVRYYNDMDIYFKQTADIDLTTFANDEEGKGWKPIGQDAKQAFLGHYDGNGYVIMGLTVDRPEEFYGGLFGYTASESSVSNVTLLDASVRSGGTAGGLIGLHEGTARNIYVTGNVATTEPEGEEEFNPAGGLVGVNYGIIQGSYSNVNVQATYVAGGLAGFNMGGTIEESYAAGDVSAYDEAGGLVGVNSGNVATSYAVGTVSIDTESEHDGGLVGVNDEDHGTIENSYYNIELLSEPASQAGHGTGLTTAEMTNADTYVDAGWNFEQVWAIEPSRNEGYPYLKQIQRAVSYAGNGNDGGTAPTDTLVYPRGGTVVVAGNSGQLTKEGQAFDGWNTEADGSGTSYASGAALRIGPADVVLYAQWRVADGGDDNGDGDNGGEEAPYVPVYPVVTQPGATVLVNGQTVNAGTLSTNTVNGRMVSTIKLDADKFGQLLTSAGAGAIITVPVAGEADAVVGELSGALLANMSRQQAVLSVETGRGSYTIGASQVNLVDLLKTFGDSATLENIIIRIEISAPEAQEADVLEKAATEGGFTLVAPPVSFTVTGVYGDTSIELDSFDSYVERRIALPDDLNRAQAATAVVLEERGGVRHVPTQFVTVDGITYASIMSLTNSTYAVIGNDVVYSDVEGHWAMDAVNDMGSRLIVGGIGGGLFQPDRDMTRAEFAAIVVRALGLKPKGGATAFADVAAADWYREAIGTAYAYGLISGFEDGSFRPAERVTREQAMVIIARAMRLAGLEGAKASGKLLLPFGDADAVSDWAADGIASSLQAGIVTGRSETVLAPQDYVSRAEVAVMVRRLLSKADLI